LVVEERFEVEKCLSQSSVGGKRKRAECHMHKGGGQWKGEMRVLGGVVYMTKSRGLRTEPRGTPQEEVYKEEMYFCI